MEPILFICLVLSGVLIVVASFAFALYNMTFKNKVDIARQTGKDVSDVIWVTDKFRVRNRDGYYVIEFKRLRNKTPSIPGSFWTKFVQSKYERRTIRMTKEHWDVTDMSRRIQRGLKLYETSEGEYFPMQITTQDGKPVLSVVTQDNRQFIIHETQDVNSLTRSKKREMTVLVMAIVAILVLCLVFIFGIIYMNETAKTTLATQVRECAQYSQILYNQTTGQGPATFLQQATATVGG